MRAHQRAARTAQRAAARAMGVVRRLGPGLGRSGCCGSSDGFDGLVGGGGDVLRDDRGWRHLSFATEKYFVAKAFGKPWYVLNAGIGPPTTGYGGRVLRYVLERARQVVVRDRRGLRGGAEGAGPDPDLLRRRHRAVAASSVPGGMPPPAPDGAARLRRTCSSACAATPTRSESSRCPRRGSASSAAPSTRWPRAGCGSRSCRSSSTTPRTTTRCTARSRRACGSATRSQFVPWTVDVGAHRHALPRGVAGRGDAAACRGAGRGVRRARPRSSPTTASCSSSRAQRGVTVIDAADLDRPAPAARGSTTPSTAAGRARRAAAARLDGHRLPGVTEQPADVHTHRQRRRSPPSASPRYIAETLDIRAGPDVAGFRDHRRQRRLARYAGRCARRWHHIAIASTTSSRHRAGRRRRATRRSPRVAASCWPSSTATTSGRRTFLAAQLAILRREPDACWSGPTPSLSASARAPADADDDRAARRPRATSRRS